MTPDRPAKTILVVEDEPDMSIFLSNLLSANGFCPICAVSLTEGLKKAVDGCPDLVIKVYRGDRCAERDVVLRPAGRPVDSVIGSE